MSSDAALLRIAEAVKAAEHGLWDFGEEYAVLNAMEGFNYQGLARRVKEVHGVDLFPPSVASKLRKAYEKYVLDCGLSLSYVKKYSPYYLYELSTATDITRDNVHYWLERTTQMSRADLLEEIRTGEPHKKEPMAMLRVPENVYARIEEARSTLGMAVGYKHLSNTVLLEFVTELVINTNGTQLRRLWDVMHGEAEEE